ncbi:MAG: hypothetical protein JWM81_784 [Candidatus Saccharibacteria bacterium]|nr:hypothetical protein [Candidatus Saccharibacteria bacterium]
MRLVDNNNQLVIILEDGSDVLEANQAWITGGGRVPEGSSIMSYPMTQGGEFPKTLGSNVSKIVAAGMAVALEQEAELIINPPTDA